MQPFTKVNTLSECEACIHNRVCQYKKDHDVFLEILRQLITETKETENVNWLYSDFYKHICKHCIKSDTKRSVSYS